MYDIVQCSCLLSSARMHCMMLNCFTAVWSFCDPMQVWDLKDLGLQASQRIAQASDPLRLLTHISQNFPTLAASLSRLPVNASLAAEVRSNQRSLPAGTNMHCLVCCLASHVLCLAPCVLGPCFLQVNSSAETVQQAREGSAIS